MITFSDLFQSTSEKYQSNVAIIKFTNDIFEAFTYKELQEASEILYEEFRNKFKTGETIGIYCSHNVLIPVLINIIHKCNCIFMFLDVNADKSYNEQILHDMNIAYVFAIDNHMHFDPYSSTNLTESISNFNCKLYLHEKTKKGESSSQNDRNSNFAYSIKTSGSTGISKYVLVTHNSIFPNVKDFESIFDVSSNDVIYFSTPLTFDPSMIELYLAIKCGAILLITSPSLKRIFNEKFSVTIWQTTPSLFLRFGVDEIKDVILSKNSSLRILALGGETMYFDINKLKSKNNCTKIFNLYGITEISCWASAKEICNPEFSVNASEIGNVLSETFVEIHNENNEKVLNELGNIFIGSHTRICLVGSECSAFLNGKKAFFEIKKPIWHNSGDLGIERNNIIYFNGRSDRLIKRFGHKINLSEIEETVLKFNCVKQCICIWDEKNLSIVTLFTSEKNITSDLWEHLRKYLQMYSLPDHLIQVDELPLNDHGKISADKSRKFYEDLTKNEKSYPNWVSLFISLVSKYSSCNKDVSNHMNDSFIDLGGTSIGVAQLVNEFESKSNNKIPELYIQLLDKECTLNLIIEYIHKKQTDLKLNEDIGSSNSGMKRNSDFEINNIPKRSRLIQKKIQFIWKFNTGKCIDARVILYENKNNVYILIGSHSGVAAILNAYSGESYLTMNLNSRIQAPFCCYDTENSFYAVVGCYDGSLWCFSVDESSKIIWKTMLNSMIKSQACHNDTYVFVGTYHSVIYMIDKYTGKQLSSIQISSKGIAADLVIHQKLIFVGTLDGFCGCVTYNEENLQLVWKNKLESPIFARPSILKNGLYILFSEVNKKIHCFCTKTGQSIWIFDDIQGNLFSSTSTSTKNDRDIITFGCHDRHTYRLSSETPKRPILDWKVQHPSEVYATPFIKHDLSTISISTNGQIFLIDENGETIGNHSLPGEVFSSPTAHEDFVYIGCRDDNIYCLKIL